MVTVTLSGVRPAAASSTAPVRTGEIIREILSSNEKGLHFEVGAPAGRPAAACAVLQRTLLAVALSSVHGPMPGFRVRVIVPHRAGKGVAWCTTRC